MKIHNGSQYTLVNGDEMTAVELEKKILSFNDNHLLIQFSKNENIIEKNIPLFHKIAKTLKKNNLSFILISKGLDIDNFPEHLNLVPTLQEAKDLLEMEAIERDLGF